MHCTDSHNTAAQQGLQSYFKKRGLFLERCTQFPISVIFCLIQFAKFKYAKISTSNPSQVEVSAGREELGGGG